jgi:hypothetical protein
VIEDLVADDTRHFEALLAGDRVDNHVAMDADEVLRVEDAVLVLQWNRAVSHILTKAGLGLAVRARRSTRSGGVDAAWCEWGRRGRRDDAGRKKSSKYLTRRIYDLGCKVLVFVPDHLAECVLNGRVVAVDKVAVDELHR